MYLNFSTSSVLHVLCHLGYIYFAPDVILIFTEAGIRVILKHIGVELPKLFFDQADQFLLALVGHFHVLNQLGELDRPLGRQEKSVFGLGQKVDELGVVSGRDTAQLGVGRRHVGGDGGVQEVLERRPVV